jgi:DASS family divalent anion:Na+ symporter
VLLLGLPHSALRFLPVCLPAPMFFAQGYVEMKDWWRVGFLCAVTNLFIWMTFGFAWWKWLGLW